MVLPRRGWAIVALITGIMASGCATTPPPDDTGVPLPAASSSASKASSMPSRSTVEPTPARATSATPTKIATTQPLIHRNTNGSLTVTVSGDLLWHPSTWGTGGWPRKERFRADLRNRCSHPSQRRRVDLSRGGTCRSQRFSVLRLSRVRSAR